MTGFAWPEVLVGVYNAFRAGDVARAAVIFDRYMPLMRYEFQPKIGLAYRKHVFQKRGIFDTAFIRPPGMKLDEYTRSELEAVIRRVGFDLETAGPHPVRVG
jgi:4-hydroxy-tetrahydrodipicolinate synthase